LSFPVRILSIIPETGSPIFGAINSVGMSEYVSCLMFAKTNVATHANGKRIVLVPKCVLSDFGCNFIFFEVHFEGAQYFRLEL
jgi:hypothetical protein